jgi:hypothetical protein
MALAESFAAIIALIGQYRSESSSKTQGDVNEFMQWLEETNHQEIKELLELNTKATIYIKSILNQDREVLKEQLERIDSALVSFASTIDGFSGLAQSIKPESVISEQALSILKQFDESGSAQMFEIKVRGGSLYQYSQTSGSLDYSDLRFISDDFSTLVELGLLRYELGKQGNDVYTITRAASDLVNSVNS